MSSGNTESRTVKLLAIDPESGKEFEVLVRPSVLLGTRDKGLGALYELNDTVRATLLRPSAIFRGLRHDADEPRSDRDSEGWLCYSSVPEQFYDYRTGRPYRSEGRVFLVFVTSDKFAYHWRRESEDPHESGTPVNWRTRFRERLI